MRERFGPGERIGLLGLGIMGSAIAPNLLKAGFEVVGFDPDPISRERLRTLGGSPVDSPFAVAEAAEVLISLLPSPQALNDVIQGPEGLLESGRSGLILIESSTLAIADKLAAQAAGAHALVMLDCPLSGTGAQAANKDLVVYASGDTAAIARCRSVFDGFARSHHDLGVFGNGSKMKFVANLLVAIHNVAAAEAMVLGMKSGLDPQTLYQVIADGAGGSRMFSVRGPQMVADHYEPATMKIDVWQKDMKIIADFAASMSSPTPLLEACAPIYAAAVAQGRGHQDTAAVCAVLADLANLRRRGVIA
jgi:3-hydroxyisobutyrate dehydrogenase-like beta-hydroxyacid dehydrogenase